MAGKKEIQITFKIDEEYNDWIREQAKILDKDESELIRASVLMAVPIFRAYPLFMAMVQAIPKPSL